MDLMDYRRKIIANSPHLMSASGAVATFSDGADLPLNSLNVNIEPVQSGTGDPSPSNVRPITGWNGVKVTRCGKNLSPINANNVSPRNYWGTNWTELIAVLNTLPVGVYTISNKFTVSTLPNSGQVAHGRIYITAMVNGTQRGVTSYSVINDTSPTVGKVYQESGTFTITEEIRGNINHAYLYCDSTDHSASSADKGTYTLTDVQIELGSTATPYEPYNGVSVSVDLGQTVYGGTLNPLTGVLTVDSQIITGNANWGTYWNSHKAEQVDTNKRATFTLSLTNETVYAQRASAKCNMLMHDAVILNGLGNKSAFCLHPTLGQYLYVCLPLDTLGMSSATSATSDDDFKNAIKAMGDNLQIVIPLATPYTIQLTPHQIRSLYGNNTIFADTGNVALEYWAHP